MRAQTNRTPYALIFILCAIGIWTVTARHGMGLTHDSFGYLSYGDVLRSEGLQSSTSLYTVFPPLYPAILALLHNNMTAIRGLHMLVTGLNAVVFMALLHKTGVRNKALTSASALVLFWSPAVLYYQGSILSEGLFVLLLQLATYAAITRRWRYAFLFCVLATLQRFIGIIVIVPCFVLLWRAQGPRRAIPFAIGAGVPLAIWMARNALLADAQTRELAFHPVSSAHLANAADFTAYWLVPLVAVLLLARLLGSRVGRSEEWPDAVVFAAVFIPVYLVFLVAHISFYDFQVPMNGRLLQPVLVLGWVALVWRVDTVLRAGCSVRPLLAFIYGGYGVANMVALLGFYVTGVGAKW